MIIDLICLHDMFGYEVPESDTMSSSFLLTRKAMVHQTPTQPSPTLTGCRPNLKVYVSGGRSSETGWSCQVRAHQSGNEKTPHSGFNLCGNRQAIFYHNVFFLFFFLPCARISADCTCSFLPTDSNSRKQEAEWKEKAKVELEEWHARQNEQLEKTKTNNRYRLCRAI